jgi:hypothetical protein
MRTILAAVAAALAIPASASACGYGMPSPAARLALADSVLVGRVLSIESRPLKLRLAKGQEPLRFNVAVVKVDSTIKGDDRLTHVRVALHQHQVMPPNFEGVFYLNLHAEEPVYLMSTEWYDYPISRAGNSGFEAQVGQLKRMGKLLRDPLAGLKSNQADDRFLTAALLISEWRSFRPSIHEAANKTAPADAELSKLILQVLAESDWNRAAADFRLTPRRVFSMLGVQQSDGFDLSKLPAAEHVEASKRWLKDNAERFRIQTFVRR